MAKKARVSRARVASSTLLPAVGATLQWDGQSGVCQDVEPTPGPTPGPASIFQAKGPPVITHQAFPYWTTGEIRLVPLVPRQRIAWEQEAARLTFSLDPALLVATAHGVVPGARGELVWVHGQEKTELSILAVHPALLVHTPYESLRVERVEIVPSLQAHDPLLHHIAVVLQATIEGEGLAGQVYAEVLADALVIHFLRRYAAARPALHEVTGGLTPHKLQHTIAYIQAHLEQELSLVTLAAVGQTSPAHFARLFKHATGVAPHQYVITCRMEQAKRLLAETDVPLIEIGPRVGCADQSHFSALFRKHVELTPKAYRDKTRS